MTYLVNPPKCQLIIKPGGERQASNVFAGTNVEITQGARVLGPIIGSSEASKNFLKDAETKYTKSLDRLGQFALTSPQNAYACLTKGVQQKLSFLSRTTPSMDGVLDKVERLGRVVISVHCLRLRFGLDVILKHFKPRSYRGKFSKFQT